MKYALICVLIYIALMSLVTFILYAADKKKAREGKWRIKEATLLGFGLAGGAIGGLFGMNSFRHKTKHWYFWAVNIVAVILHAAIVGFMIYKCL